jgi:hypothetical protein
MKELYVFEGNVWLLLERVVIILDGFLLSCMYVCSRIVLSRLCRLLMYERIQV